MKREMRERDGGVEKTREKKREGKRRQGEKEK